MQIHLVLPDSDRSRLVKAASSKRISVSGWCRMILAEQLDALDKATPQAKPHVQTFTSSIEQKIRAGLAFLREDSFPCRFAGQIFETAEAFRVVHPGIRVTAGIASTPQAPQQDEPIPSDFNAYINSLKSGK